MPVTLSQNNYDLGVEGAVTSFGGSIFTVATSIAGSVGGELFTDVTSSFFLPPSRLRPCFTPIYWL